jgi:hypothetical protein
MLQLLRSLEATENTAAGRDELGQLGLLLSSLRRDVEALTALRGGDKGPFFRSLGQGSSVDLP